MPVEPLYAPAKNTIVLFAIIVGIVVIFILFKLLQLSKKKSKKK